MRYVVKKTICQMPYILQVLQVQTIMVSAIDCGSSPHASARCYRSMPKATDEVVTSVAGHVRASVRI
eukprot:SAG31_NODE_2478_length_5637_cov_2.220657_2_plen_67_part_00